jgi:hypothetical protein
MSATTDALRTFVAGILGSGWRVQFGEWVDAGPTYRYCVIRPAGGIPAELVREPQFTVKLLAAEGDSATYAHDAADSLVEAMRTQAGGLVYLAAGEPVSSPTGDGRHTSEFAVSAIVN